jgi:hypothetical protein
MALFLDCNTGGNALLISPNSNGVYSNCVGVIQGTLYTDDLAGETIDSISIDQATITVGNINFDGSPPSFPYTITFSAPVTFTFEIYPTDTPGNSDQFKFTFNISPFGAYPFAYDVTELDIQNSITVANNTLPLDFGTVEVGNTSYVMFAINNETCIRYSYSWYSNSPEIGFAGGSASPFPRTTYYETAGWTPTAAGDLSVYKIFCDTDCGNAIYDLAGTSTEPPPPPVGGAFSKKLIISNSISI